MSMTVSSEPIAMYTPSCVKLTVRTGHLRNSGHSEGLAVSAD